MSDELHQFFVPDRVCSIVDVGIDTAGAICGTAVFALIAFLLRRKKKHIKTAQ
jgi:VanZ family protein